MRGGISKDDYDIVPLVAKPLYLGLLINVVLPMGLLLVCYYLNNKYYLENRVGDLANTLFYAMVVLALAQGGVALWWRKVLFDRPMVRREETMLEDIQQALVRRSRPVFVLIAAISLYGYVYFYLTGRFREAALVVLFSFIVFQFVRPRINSVRKLIERQRELVKQGKLLARGE